MPKKYKHIIWDWNGTLLDDARLCHEIINEIIVENNLPAVSFERYLEVFTFPVRKYYEAVGLPVENGEFERLGKIFMEEYEKRKLLAPLHEGARETLEKIASNGVGQSVLSAYSTDKLEDTLAKFSIREYFTKVAGLDNIYAAGKTEVGKRLVASLNLAENEAVMIGDTLHDAEVARTIGADAVLIAHGHQSERRLRESGNVVVSSFEELQNLICE